MKYYFFLSYAPTDHSPYLERFFAELQEQVRQVAALGMDEDVGYFNRQAIQAGEVWDDALTEALQTCATMVCLWSPSYAASEYAGKELAFFSKRWHDSERARGGRDSDAIPVIQHVIWKPLLGATPDILRASRLKGWETLNENGLLVIRKMKSRYGSEYAEFVRRLALEIVDAAGRFPLPPLETAPSLSNIESAFDERGPEPAAWSGTGQPFGPEVAHFVYVAGSKEEMLGVRRKIDSYGLIDREWMPFYPDYQRQVGLITQACAAEIGYVSDSVPPDESIMKHVRRADETNTPVVVVVDPWTLDIEKYAERMRAFDENNFANAAVLVVWNLNDPETREYREMLKDLVRAVFTLKWSSSDPMFFTDGIASPDELHHAILSTLAGLRTNIIKRSFLHGGVRVAVPLPSNNPPLKGAEE
jgi:FxsC-like protein